MPPPHGRAAARGAPVSGLRCGRAAPTLFGVHVELFAHGRAMVVPAGIGVAPPLVRDGAYVRAGRCEYALRTHEPTGVVEVATRRPVTLGDLLALWGQPITPTRLAGFAAGGGAGVAAFVDGRRVADPRAVALRRHAQIVLMIGRRVPVHARYRFPPGL